MSQIQLNNIVFFHPNQGPLSADFSTFVIVLSSPIAAQIGVIDPILYGSDFLPVFGIRQLCFCICCVHERRAVSVSPPALCAIWKYHYLAQDTTVL